MFNRASIFPSFDTITRIGLDICFLATRASRNSAGRLRRTLSRLSVLCPIKTASANARWRNKCSLSSREVKSTGEKLRVVILASTVMAKVALTNGRCDFRGADGDLRADLLRLADFMLECRDFPLHLAQAYMSRHAAWFVEEIDDRAWNTADEDDQKTE